MLYENYFKEMFESITEFRKKVFGIFSIQNDKDLFEDCGFLKIDINRSSKKFKNILMEQNEEYLDHIKNQEESIIERIPKEQLDQPFSVMFEDVGHERSLKFLLSLIDPNILKQAKFTDHEINIIKNLALEKLHRQRILQEKVAIVLLEAEVE